jgi:hypothetical protein
MRGVPSPFAGNRESNAGGLWMLELPMPEAAPVFAFGLRQIAASAQPAP